MNWTEAESIVKIAAAPLAAQIYVSDLDREDVMQEGRIAVWQAMERVPGSVAGYLIVRARGAMIDALRKASWVPRSEYGGEKSRMYALEADHRWQPCQAVSEIHTRRVLRQMADLPPQQAAVAEMLAEGHAPAVIASRLGVSTPRVSQIRTQLEDWVRRRL